MTTSQPLVGIFGGSYNPPHLGHMRLAVEVIEALRPSRLDFLPCAVPPHKGTKSILPFDLRARMLEESVLGIAGLRVNRLESQRSGPSYTSDTLRLYAEKEPDARHFFILGAEDFADIVKWHEWEILPRLADIVVVPRAGSEVEVFMETVRHSWPEARPLGHLAGAANAVYSLPPESGGGRLLHLPLPRLDIRAELVRERFLAGRSIRFLVPDAVARLLAENPEATACW